MYNIILLMGLFLYGNSRVEFLMNNNCEAVSDHACQ